MGDFDIQKNHWVSINNTAIIIHGQGLKYTATCVSAESIWNYTYKSIIT